MKSVKSYQYVGATVLDEWPLFEPLIEEGLQYGYGEKTTQDILNSILEERSQLFVAVSKDGVESLMVTSLIIYPQYKVVFIETMAGRGFIEYARFFWDSFTAWARANGAIAVEGACRPAVTRLLRRLKMRKVYDIVRVSLEDNHVWN